MGGLAMFKKSKERLDGKPSLLVGWRSIFHLSLKLSLGPSGFKPVFILLLLFFILVFNAQILDGSERLTSTPQQKPTELPELVVQSGHSGPITAMSLCPDNQMLATASVDGTVKLWDANTQRLLRTFAVSPYFVYSIAFSPNGKILATGSGDYLVRLWEVASGQRTKTLVGADSPIWSVAFSSNGEMLASSTKGAIWVWNATSGEKLSHTQVAGGGIQELQFLPNSNLLLVRQESQLTLWDLKTNQPRKPLWVHTGKAGRMLLSAEGPLLGAFGEETSSQRKESLSLNLWELKSGNLTAGPKYFLPAIQPLAFHPDHKSVIAISLAGDRIGVWDLEVGSWKQVIEGTIAFFGYNAHPDYAGADIPYEAFAVSSDARFVAIADGESFRIVNMELRKISSKGSDLPAAPRKIQFLQNGNLLAAGLSNGRIDLWSIESGRPVRSFRGHKGPVHSLGIDPEEEFIISSGNDDAVLVWDLSTGNLLHSFMDPTEVGFYSLRSPLGTRSEIPPSDASLPFPRAPKAVRIFADSQENKQRDIINLFASAVSPVERILAYGGYSDPWPRNPARKGNFAVLMDMSSRKEIDFITVKEIGSNDVRVLSFSPNGKLLAIGYEDGKVILRDLAQRKNIPLDAHPSTVNAIQFSPDSFLLATAGDDGLIQFWNPETGKNLQTIKTQASTVKCLSFSHDGQFLASGGGDLRIQIWEVKSGNPVRTLEAHSSDVNSLAYSPQGNILVSASEDTTIKFWETSKYQLLASAASLSEKDWVAFTPEGFFDGTSHAWELVPFRFPSELMRFYEPEQFFNQFYQPGLLADVLRNAKPMREILTDLRDPRAQINVSQYRSSILPVINFLTPESDQIVSSGKIKVKIAAQDTGFGLRGLRVFRNRSLVHYQPEDLQPNPVTKTVEVTVPIKLVAGPNKISAYVFNRDNLKSKEAQLSITGAESLRRKGTAYILAMGVNRYSNPGFNLKYARADADSLTKDLKESLDKTGEYSRIVTANLYDRDATKANILAALKQLAHPGSVLPVNAPAEVRKLKPAEPEDAVIFYFSGHGKAWGDRYYLLPHDLGYTGDAKEIDAAGRSTILRHSLSDPELMEAFLKVEAGRIQLIIDACQSGQALEMEEKRRGPMNSRGLAQLAYEKGMYILAAAQSHQSALELEKLGHGLLTHVLLEEGLKAFAADTNPKDGQVTVEEWFDYAIRQVPKEIKFATEQYLQRTGKGVEIGLIDQAPRGFYRREPTGGPWTLRKRSPQ
jgi:WD40 repeat protein